MSRAFAGMSGVSVVLRHLLAASTPQSRPEVAAACNVSRPTVFSAIARLEDLGFVARTGQRSGVPGRSAALYEVPAGAGRVAGIDIGGVNLRVEVCDVRGERLAGARRLTVPEGGASVVRQAGDLLAETLAEADTRTAAAATVTDADADTEIDAGSSPLLAVGVSVPGIVDTASGLVEFAWNVGQGEPYDFQSGLASAINAPVLLENNVNLAAIGEQWRGAAQALNTFVVIAVGAGVGAGIVHNGALLRGAHGAAGEVAFFPFDGVRRRGSSAPDHAGAVALLRQAQARSGWRGGPPDDVAELFDRAAEGEEPALAVVEDECRRVGHIIAAVCVVIDPEAVILTGGVGGNDLLIERASDFAAQVAPVPPPVVRSRFGERASLVGAVAMAVRHAQDGLLTRLETLEAQA
ncbi:ROK family transcriptional regulator [Actinomadura sp. HBU206391]|uniref:ROK family transcriptional regulator n=1 Tax=Actinomadura sp. HBU206391 TaxID=2731692 RepID=UPI001650B100|nr:ROK family transcriptional regulator [Actinomadura sp. HBU206391]MBC6458359.1 ROK family transcriptional regulator [Actinomadura sp. HBU206391]